MRNSLMLVSLLLFMTACSTAPIERFSKVKVGMYKDDVLDVMGSPNQARFKNEEHIWNYRFVTESGPVSKEIRLKKDFVIFVGDPIHPSEDKFSKIKAGHSKSDVLDLAGFPIRTENRGGVDVWTYTLNDKQKSSMGVEFTNEKVIYVGPSKEKKPESDGFVPIEK